MHLRDDGGSIEHTLDAIPPFVETAVARGVDEIGFTEHVYYFRQTQEVWDLPYQTKRCHHDLDAYCEAVLAAKQRGLPVKLGLEVDYVGERQERLSELLAPYPWDYLLGSVHWLDGLAIDQEPGIWEELSVGEVWRRYIDALCDLARSGAVDVLAHPDLAKFFGRRPADDELSPLHGRVAAAMAEAGVCMEISTAGLRKPVGELYPDAALLYSAAAAGVQVTLASDAHEPALVGVDFDRALELARSGGFQTVTVFEGRKARQEPLG